MPHPCLVIAGPTAGGKSELAMRLARELPGGGEIVCADSMQVWRGMDIGTAKPSAAERAEIPHHALDLADPHRDAFTAAAWLAQAEQAIEDIRARNRWPIVVGGTNLYLRLLLEGMAREVPSDPGVRATLEARETQDLWRELQASDPASSALIHPNDRRRTIRALEIAALTGAPASASRDQWSDATVRVPDHMRVIGIEWSVPTINARINARVQRMLDAGWKQEAIALAHAGPLLPQPLEAVGYRELLEALDGKCTLAEAAERIKTRTRRFAKQQRTWLKKFRDGEKSLWIEADHTPEGGWSRLVIHWLQSGSRTANSPSPT
jgi:tRNA dimethylallyltransferase